MICQISPRGNLCEVSNPRRAVFPKDISSSGKASKEGNEPQKWDDIENAVAKPGSAGSEEAQRYDMEIKIRAEREWNENARKTGGPLFIGEPGSGQLDSGPEDWFERDQRSRQRQKAY